MISWIQRSFQHHFRIIFGLVLGGTILSFVVTIGATPGLGNADRRNQRRDFFGHNLGSQADISQIMADGQISAMLQGGQLDDDRLKQYALERVAALSLADRLRLPPATPTEMEGFIRSLPAFADEKGQFDASRYDQFRSNPRQFIGAGSDDVARVLADDIRIDRVEKLIDGPGYVLPGDVRDQIAQADTSWTLGVATVDYASYQPAISPSEADLAKYYDANAERYAFPPRVNADYIDFPAAAYLGQVQVTDAEVRAYYDAHAAQYDSVKSPTPEANRGVVAPSGTKTGDAKFAAARVQAAADLKLERARRLASKAASDFAFGLYQDKVQAGAALEQYLAARQLKLEPLAPFSQQAGPAELGGSTDIAEAAFKLNPERYYSDALSVPGGAAVLIWKSTDPERKPLLAEVRSKVLADYTENQRRQQFTVLGQALRSDLQARLKAGAKFETAVAAAASRAGVKAEAKILPAFTLNTRPATIDDGVLASLEHLDQGAVSDMTVADGKGTLVYAQAKKAPDLKSDAARIAEVRRELAVYSARGQAIAYLSDLVAQELKRTDDAAKAE